MRAVMRLLAPGAALVLLLAPSSGQAADPSAPPGDGGPVACDLLTLEEASAALDLGEDVVSAQQQGVQCEFATATQPVFSLDYAPGDELLPGLFQACTPSRAIPTDYERAIEQLGDRAYLTDCGTLVWVGDHVLRPNAYTTVFADPLGYETEIARVALGHLGWQQPPAAPEAAWADTTCDLLSTGDVASAVGIEIPYGDPAPIETGRGLGACAYYDANGGQVLVLDYAHGASHVAVYDQIKAQPPDVGMTVAPVEGLGDEAFAQAYEGDPAQGDPAFVSLHARVGDSIVVVSMSSEAPLGDQLQQSIGLAQIVLDRLGSAAPPSVPAGPGGGGGTVCDLVGTADISALLGDIPIAAVDSADDYGQPVCEWGSPANATDQVLAVRITDMTAGFTGCEGLTPLDGIGVEACLFKSDYVPPTVYALSQGGIWLEVKSKELQDEQLVAVASQAIDKADEVLGG
jgi:hypothetical protein